MVIFSAWRSQAARLSSSHLSVSESSQPPLLFSWQGLSPAWGVWIRDLFPLFVILTSVTHLGMSVNRPRLTFAAQFSEVLFCLLAKAVRWSGLGRQGIIPLPLLSVAQVQPLSTVGTCLCSPSLFWGMLKCYSLSHVRPFVTPWTVAHQALLSVEFSRQEYWSGLPFPSPGDLLNPGIKLRSPAL